jgi:hypothetical protein
MMAFCIPSHFILAREKAQNDLAKKLLEILSQVSIFKLFTI